MFDPLNTPICRKQEKVASSTPTTADGTAADQEMTDAEAFPATYTGAVMTLLQH